MTGLVEPLVVVLGLGLSCLLALGALRGGERPLTGFELPLVVVVAVAVAVVAFLVRQEPVQLPLLSAVLVAGSALFGFFFNALLGERNAERALRERRQDTLETRQRKIEDICSALEAEIENETSEAEALGWDDWIARIDTDFAADPGFLPLVPLRVRDTVFRTVIGDIELLDRNQIRTVVYYHTLASDLRELGEMMRSDTYRVLGTARRKAVLLNFIQLEERLRVVGLDALAHLAPEDERAAYARQARAGAEAFSARYGEAIRLVSRTGPDPSAPAVEG